MIQFLLGLILMVLVLGFWGDDISSSISKFSVSSAETMVSLPLPVQIAMALIVLVLCVVNIIRLIRN